MVWMGNTAHLRRSDYTSRGGILKHAHSGNVPELATTGFDSLTTLGANTITLTMAANTTVASY